MRNRSGKRIHFLFNYSGEAQTYVSEFIGTALTQATQLDRGTALRLMHGNLRSSKVKS
jgi:beta-galactosidase